VVIASTSSGLGSIVERFGDALAGLGLFTRSGQVEERFEAMRQMCVKLELHYTRLEEIFTGLYKGHRAMEEGMRAAGKEVVQAEAAILQLKEQLGMSTDEVGNGTFRRVSVLYEDHALATHAFADAMKCDLTGPLHEYVKYCSAAKDALKERDDAQLTYEELTHYLAKSRYQLTELRGGQPVPDDPGADRSLLAPIRSGARSITGYLAGQFDRMKGVDVLEVRQQRLQQVEKRIRELEGAVRMAREAGETADGAVVREMEHFEWVLQQELKEDFLPTLIALHKAYLAKSTSRWAAALPDK